MATEQAAASITETVPTTWPRAFKLYSFSKNVMLVNWQTYLGALLVTIAFSIVVSAVFGSDTQSGRYAVGQLISILLSVYVGAVTTIIQLQSIKRTKIGFSQAFSDALKYYVPFIFMSVLLYVSLAFSLLLFVIPFFFVLPRVALAPYFLIGDNLGGFEAFKASWDATKGHAGKMWGIIGVSILFALLSVTIIGIPFSIYFLFMYSAAPAVLYAWIKAHGDNTIQGPVPAK